METLVENKTKKYVDHDIDTMYNAVLETEDAINYFVEFNEYKFNKSFIVPRKELRTKLGNSTLNQRRKLKKAINIFHKKQSLSSANRFLHFLYKEVFEVDMRVRISYSTKQLAIIKKRAEYMEALKIMKEAHNTYKKEKGNFFKMRIEKGQKLS